MGVIINDFEIITEEGPPAGATPEGAPGAAAPQGPAECPRYPKRPYLYRPERIVLAARPARFPTVPQGAEHSHLIR